MSGTESHDGLLRKISNLHSLKGEGGGGQKNPKKNTLIPTADSIERAIYTS